ncbi:MAG TPA: hypothetical protein VL485_32990 [Ktedonobacteraceae bacterium]|nr:hypothetical protein [Ktedonobacteraceae bacterium]
MFTQKTPLPKRLIVGSVLSSLLFGFGGFIAHPAAAPAQPAASSVHQPAEPTSLKDRFYAQIPGPYSDPDQYEQHRESD